MAPVPVHAKNQSDGGQRNAKGRRECASGEDFILVMQFLFGLSDRTARRYPGFTRLFPELVAVLFRSGFPFLLSLRKHGPDRGAGEPLEGSLAGHHCPSRPDKPILFKVVPI
jgi:hypothetical protein